MAHRGPDDDGTFVSERVMLAMRRLAINDLAGGRQPIASESGDIVVICNGEIYNHVMLRYELERRGHRFKTHSDVETIVHAYEEYGLACLEKLRGMFAFALWDARRESLFLVRDRLGEKPLYLYQDPEQGIFFASELTAIMAAMRGHRRLNPDAYSLFLEFQYIPEPLTPVVGVDLLPAGHFLELTLTKMGGKPVSYWNPESLWVDTSAPVEAVRETVAEACQLMGAADVPVAVALSGGIDSSLVAAVTAKRYPGKLHAFTIGYRDPSHTDERGLARRVAEELRIGFTAVELGADDLVRDFPGLMKAMDTPIGDVAAFGYYEVSRAARQAGFPVLLSGMGGDELFWGYPWIRSTMVRNEAAFAQYARSRSSLSRLSGRKVTDLQPDFLEIHPDLIENDKLARSLMPEEIAASLPRDLWSQVVHMDTSLPFHLAVSSLINRTWLRSNCLALLDRMSMAHSVELRLPLLDVELVNRLIGMRNRGLTDWHNSHKWLLVEAFSELLPQEVRHRPKQGFTPPVVTWLRAIVNQYSSLLNGGALERQGMLRAGSLPSDLEVGFDLMFLYRLVVLECWSRLHIYETDLLA